MAIEWTTAAWFLPLLLPIALWVTWSDLTRMKIPNKAVLATLGVFAGIGLLALPFDEYLWRYAHFGAVLVIGFVLSSIGAMGAGDAKFGAAMAPFIARQDAVAFLLILSAATIVTFLLHRSARASQSIRAKTPAWESWTRREFPMGIALAPALILYLVAGLIFA